MGDNMHLEVSDYMVEIVMLKHYVSLFMGNTKKKTHQNWTKNKKLTFEN